MLESNIEVEYAVRRDTKIEN